MIDNIIIINLPQSKYAEKLLRSVLQQCPMSLKPELGDTLTILDYDWDRVYLKKGKESNSDADDDFDIRTWNVYDTGEGLNQMVHIEWTLFKRVGDHGVPIKEGYTSFLDEDC